MLHIFRHGCRGMSLLKFVLVDGGWRHVSSRICSSSVSVERSETSLQPACQPGRREREKVPNIYIYICFAFSVRSPSFDPLIQFCYS